MLRDQGTGSSLLDGGAGNDTIYAGIGDTVDAGTGNDIVHVAIHTGGETVHGGAGTDYVYLDGHTKSQVVSQTTTAGVTTITFAGGENVKVDGVEWLHFTDGFKHV